MTRSLPPRPLRFCELLREERETILDGWEAAARASTEKAAALEKLDLRDHVPPLINDIIDAVEAAAQGREARLPHHNPRQHAQHRLEMGFTLDVVTHEYALLREQMIDRLYARIEDVPVERVKILHRFIDQAILEAVVAYSEAAQAQKEREQARRSEFERHLLGIVSHDLCTPLQAITASASLLQRAPDLDNRQLRLLSGITSSVARANRLIQDLLDFTTMRIGQGLQIIPADTDLYELAQQTITELQLNHPERESGSRTRGAWRGAGTASA